MKKALTLVSILVMVGAVIVIPHLVMAQSLAGGPIPISANVARYAKITPSVGLLNLGPFTGQAGEERVDGTGLFTVETNTILNLLFDFDVTHTTEGTPLITYFKIFRNIGGAWLTSPADAFVLVSQPTGNLFPSAQAAKSIETYAVTIKARTGAISAQAAGSYTGAVTLTVSAP